MGIHSPSLQLCLSLLLFLVLSLGCAKAPEAVERSGSKKEKGPPPRDDNQPVKDIEADPAVVAPARWEQFRPGTREWTLFTFDRLSQEAPNLFTSEPRDIQEFCPSYLELRGDDRRNFWVYLLSAMTHFESFYDPDAYFQEDFNDGQGRPVISRGLLQISIESGRGYDCDLPSSQVLHDPEVNLSCGLRILNHWVQNDNLISGKQGSSWRGGARYWSVLRRTSSLTHIKAWTSTQEYCRLDDSIESTSL